jgi:hypothetical protein
VSVSESGREREEEGVGERMRETERQKERLAWTEAETKKHRSLEKDKGGVRGTVEQLL